MPALGFKNVLIGLVTITGVFLAGSVTAQTSDLVSGHTLRVCADPANYPMSSDDENGYENKLDSLLRRLLLCFC